MVKNIKHKGDTGVKRTKISAIITLTACIFLLVGCGGNEVEVENWHTAEDFAVCEYDVMPSLITEEIEKVEAEILGYGNQEGDESATPMNGVIWYALSTVDSIKESTCAYFC